MQSAPPALPQIACDTVNIIFSTQHRHAKNLSTRFAAPRGILRRCVVASATLRRLFEGFDKYSEFKRSLQDLNNLIFSEIILNKVRFIRHPRKKGRGAILLICSGYHMRYLLDCGSLICTFVLKSLYLINLILKYFHSRLNNKY
jgi:hypothetical protein